MQFSVSLRTAWFSLIVLVGVLPAAILLYWGSRHFFDLLLEQALLQEDYYRELRVTNVRHELSRLITLLENKSDPMAYTLARERDRQLLDELLFKISSREPAVHQLLILEQDGSVITGLDKTFSERSLPPDHPGLQSHWASHSPEVASALAASQHGDYFVHPVQLHPEGVFFTLAVPIGSRDQPVATLLAQVDANSLWREIGFLQAREGVITYLVNRRGQLLNEPTGSALERGRSVRAVPVVQAFVEGRVWPKTQHYAGLNGQPVFGTATLIAQLGLGVISEMEEARLLQPIQRVVWKVSGIIAIFLLACVALGLWLVTQAVNPIAAISAEFERVRALDYSPSRVRSHLKELVSMVAGFNRMVEELDGSQRDLRQAAVVFENTAEAITITDTDNRIIAVNQAFTRITGYKEEEVLGCNPSLLNSGRHDEAFYQTMWRSIKETGHWRGEIWNRRKSGEIYPELLTVNTVKNDAGEITHYVGIFGDISALKETESKLEYLAHHDALTGLPNRLLLNDRLAHAIKRAARGKNQVAVLFLDLDRFKTINDSMGHPQGDRLLQLVATRLSKSLRAEDTIARLGGDEFVLVIEELKSRQDVALVAENILALFGRPFQLDEREVFIDASIGIGIYPEDGADSDTLLRNADAAMYRAKSEGRNTYQFYIEALTAEALERLTLESSLRRALERDEFRLFYQPQFSLVDGALVGAEALIRWFHPEMGLVSPAKFIPLAEETGLIVPIGEWVLQEACSQQRSWQQAGWPPLKIAVNLSARQFHKPGLVKVIANILEKTGIEPAWLELELTESIIMRDAEATIRLLKELHQMGLEISIDDFGTGYSSLSYMKRFPIHKLKIDQSFVRDISTDKDDAEIVASIIALAQSMNLRVIAEGVETEEQLRYLVARGCHEAQGYHYSRPVPPEEIEQFFTEASLSAAKDPSSPMRV